MIEFKIIKKNDKINYQILSSFLVRNNFLDLLNICFVLDILY
jgi:hypothetical protein